MKTLTSANRSAAVLGAADGLTIVLGLLMSLRTHQDAIFRASLGAGLAELVGMGAALWLSEENRRPGRFLTAMACGVMTALACVVPAIPYLFIKGVGALLCALLITAIIGGTICSLRPEKGWVAISETYGVLAASATLCYLASLVH